MDKLYLSPYDSDEMNVLKIIEYIRKSDVSQGLTDEQIDYKYTHGFCADLAFLIERVFSKVLGIKVESKQFDVVEKGDAGDKAIDSHFYVEYATEKGKGYADILGVMEIDKIQEWLRSDYMRSTRDDYLNIIKGAKAALIFENTEEACLKNIELDSPETLLE